MITLSIVQSIHAGTPPRRGEPVTGDGSDQLEAADDEPGLSCERLELLAVVRGLEALPQPARVTLVTPSKYVNRGLSCGLPEWRSNGWQWEHFGEMVPVKNRDLWQRVARALDYHQVECRTWRFDLPHARPAGPAVGVTESSVTAAAQAAPATPRRRQRRRRLSLFCKRLAVRTAENWRLALARLGTRLMPLPWFE